MDEYGYPDAEDLARVRTWTWEDPSGLFAFLRERWMYGDVGYFREEVVHDRSGREIRRLHLSTAGWSGNESLLAALRENKIIWSFTWLQSRRGGHHQFEIPMTDQEGKPSAKE